MCEQCRDDIQDYYDEWLDQYGYGKQQSDNSRGSDVRNRTADRTGDETDKRETQQRWKNTYISSSSSDWHEIVKDEPVDEYMLEYYVNDIFDEALDILITKHQDYGPSNISDSPGGPLVGLAVRLHDKVARLAHLTSNNKEPKHESLHDTFIDIINYAAIGILVLEDHWDKGGKG